MGRPGVREGHVHPKGPGSLAAQPQAAGSSPQSHAAPQGPEKVLPTREAKPRLPRKAGGRQGGRVRPLPHGGHQFRAQEAPRGAGERADSDTRQQQGPGPRAWRVGSRDDLEKTGGQTRPLHRHAHSTPVHTRTLTLAGDEHAPSSAPSPCSRWSSPPPRCLAHSCHHPPPAVSRMENARNDRKLHPGGRN